MKHRMPCAIALSSLFGMAILAVENPAHAACHFEMCPPGGADVPSIPGADDTLADFSQADYWITVPSENGTLGLVWESDAFGLGAPDSFYLHASSVGGTEYVKDVSLGWIDNVNMTCTYHLTIISQTIGMPAVTSYKSVTTPWKPYQICDASPSDQQRDARSPAITVGERPYLFLAGGGELRVNWWTGSEWIWSSLGRPGTAQVSQFLAVVNVEQRPYVFVKGSDENVWICWWTGTEWGWAFAGTPPSQGVGTSYGAVTVSNRPYLFVGSNYRIWTYWWTGSEWAWSDLGQPAGVSLYDSFGALTVSERPYTFALGSDYTLWTRWWTGSEWSWYSFGTPLDVIGQSCGSLTVGNRPYNFTMTYGNDLWVNWWTGSEWNWADLGKHPGADVHAEYGCFGAAVSDGNVFVYVKDVIRDEPDLWLQWWTGVNWRWENLGHPPYSQARYSLGAVTVSGRPYLYVVDDYGDIWLNWWSGTQWAWYNLGYYQ